jgi:tRNA/rRNA methyltransferase
MNSLLSNIRIVLMETSHPGNIGAAARAMKTMGLGDLVLVNPGAFPSAIATARAAGADDILYHATVVDSLDDALGSSVFACATTARRREIAVPVTSPREIAPGLVERARSGPIAIVFGRESSGLTNDEVRRCQRVLELPASPQYSSLNLGAAVQLISYELRLAALAEQASAQAEVTSVQRISVADLEGLYGHLERTLTTIGYLDPAQPKKLMPRLRALFGRADLTSSELNILRGILRATDEMAARAELPQAPHAGLDSL